jgi:Arc/MetJ family transcription regulator
MATNLALDDRLINEALEIGHHKSKRAAVTEALQTYVRLLKQRDILSLFGTIHFDDKYDYKKGRVR